MANKKVEVKDLRRIQMVTDPQIAPDGRPIAFVHTAIEYAMDEYVSNIWLAEIESRTLRQFQLEEGKISIHDGLLTEQSFFSRPHHHKKSEKRRGNHSSS